MNPILILDCGSRFLPKLVAAVMETEASVEIRTVPIQGKAIPTDARYPVLSTMDLDMVEPAGVVISGTPHYLYMAKGRIPPDGFFQALLDRRIPALGICGGHELLAHLIAMHHATGEKPLRVVGVNPSGNHEVQAITDNPCEFTWHVDQPTVKRAGETIFQSLPDRFPTWMWHMHQVRVLPPCCISIGSTAETPNGAIAYQAAGEPVPLVFGVQFHPEISPERTRHAIFSNFTFLCGERT
jgi:GMP synthase-like glutamine amidotransferase